ncbi:hypothetical protein [Mesorhizobium sp. SARCC-RB16n]|uniref:hypothetical protein n=1 Tax=Mesorhizobium sp. SARCC-RB16n TaxID=2116687 RepID=UPI00122EA85A|nr:hypothetical protein [Mesorhizobium sp. SARCC-RB16n]
MVETTDVALDLSDGSLRLLAAPNAAPVRNKIVADLKAGKPVPTSKAIKQAIAESNGKTKASAGGAPESARSPVPTSKRDIIANAKDEGMAPAKDAPSRTAANDVTSAVASGATLTLGTTSPTVATAESPWTETPSTTSKPAPSNSTASMSPDEAATRLMKILASVLPRFATLYHIAGHEVFRSRGVPKGYDRSAEKGRDTATTE